jgi:hypothetical protein
MAETLGGEARVETVLVRRRGSFVSTALICYIDMARERLAARAVTRQTAERPGLTPPPRASRVATETATAKTKAMTNASVPLSSLRPVSARGSRPLPAFTLTSPFDEG